MKLLVMALFGAVVSAQTTLPTEREKQLLDRIAALEERITILERRMAQPPASSDSQAGAQPSAAAAAVPSGGPGVGLASTPTPDGPLNGWLKDTSVNFFFDGYYGWNANRPAGRMNQLRAYDVAANSFSVNQAGLVVERSPDAGAGRRWGYRLDLMFGQATETLGGATANEPRTQVYRNLFQAYGTYVAPVGKGLTIDFGKWASSLGLEGNYAKDQINYSRAPLFNLLPFYHAGVRATYAFNDRVSLSYWLVNGANQTEDFNEYKSQNVQAVMKPAKTVTWTVNYYVGQEQREGRGREHIFDTYALWTPTGKLTLGAEFDDVISRVSPHDAPQRVTGGAGYFRYQIAPAIYFGQRYTRLNDHGGLYSGVSQKLNETTSTLGFQPAGGFEARLEYRRDSSNVPFFLKRGAGQLSPHQDTVMLGLLWWFGGKSGGW